MAKIVNFFENQGFPRKNYGKIFMEEEAAPSGAAPVGLLSTVEDYSIEKRESILVATIITTTEPRQRKKPYQKPQAVKELEQLADLDNQRRHPHTLVKYLARCKYRDDTYSGLAKCIVDYIRLQGGTAQRLALPRPQDTRQTVRDVIGRKYTIGSVDYRPSGGDTNGADIHAVMGGFSVLIAARPGSHCYQDGDVYFFGDLSQFLKWYNQAFGV